MSVEAEGVGWWNPARSGSWIGAGSKKENGRSGYARVTAPAVLFQVALSPAALLEETG